MKLFNKKGSYTVFIVMAFSAVLIMVYGVLNASGKAAVSSTTEYFGQLWGKSILAEYDVRLKERYGVFGFYGNQVLVEDKLRFYADYTFKTKKYIKLSSVGCTLNGYELTDTKIFKEQLGRAVVFGSKPKPMKKAYSGQGNEPSETVSNGNRYIKNRWIIQGLPSKGSRGDFSITGLVSAAERGAPIKSLIGSSLVNEYIFSFFKDRNNERTLGDTYLRNEIEYIISGKYDDKKAENYVSRRLFIIRNLLNLYYLGTCTEKKEAAMAAALTITPGPQAAFTQKILLEMWALAEAANDMGLINDGKTVPLIKKDRNWALGLENILDKVTVNDKGEAEAVDSEEEEEPPEERRRYIEPETVEGADYQDYLKIMVNFVPEETKLLRIMDLIQINMKYLYCDCFLMSDYYTGLDFSMKVNGVLHEFKEVY